MITTITTNTGLNFFYNGKSYAVSRTHEKFSDIENALSENDGDSAVGFLKPIASIEKFVSNKDFDTILKVNTESCQVFLVDGDNLEDITYTSIGKRILSFATKGLPYEPLANFLQRLKRNPSYNSRKQLYNFLEHTNLPITNDGHFLAYKGVRKDYLDQHSKTFDNSPGKVLEMDRSHVDDNPDNHCSSGFHAGTLGYATNFASHVVIVKINPEDVVSVPNDHNAQKLRTWRYEVLADFERAFDNDYEPEFGGQEDLFNDDDDNETEEADRAFHSYLSSGVYNPPEGDDLFFVLTNNDGTKELLNAISKSGKFRTSRYGGLWRDPANYLPEGEWVSSEDDVFEELFT